MSVRLHTTPVYKIEYGPSISSELTDDIINIAYKYDGYVSEDETELSISKLDLAYEMDHSDNNKIKEALSIIINNSDPDDTDCHLFLF